jgi:hypothetical protein
MLEIKNKKILEYIKEKLSINIDKFSRTFSYEDRWLYSDGIILPHLRQDDNNFYSFVDEKIITTDKDLKNGKIYFIGEPEGVFKNSKQELFLLRLAKEFCYVNYAIVLKNKEFYGVFIADDECYIANQIVRFFYEDYKLTKNALKILKDDIHNLDLFKQKLIHIIKLSIDDMNEDLTEKIYSLLKNIANA